MSTVAAKLSPASSDQVKFLRVLKTIDVIYSPKPVSGSTDADNEKVQSIYESFKFSPLWKRLPVCDCLSDIEDKPEMKHLVVILLSLIESLMVVCEYVGPGTAPEAAARGPSYTRLHLATLAEQRSHIFTDTHRRVLNLMGGSLQLLVHDPSVLDFNNKRNYLNHQLHHRHNRGYRTALFR